MIAEPPLLPGAVQRDGGLALPAVAVPMVGAPGAVTTGPPVAAPGLPEPVDRAQLAPTLLSAARLVSSSDGPLVGTGQPAPP